MLLHGLYHALSYHAMSAMAFIAHQHPYFSSISQVWLTQKEAQCADELLLTALHTKSYAKLGMPCCGWQFISTLHALFLLQPSFIHHFVCNMQFCLHGVIHMCTCVLVICILSSKCCTCVLLCAVGSKNSTKLPNGSLVLPTPDSDQVNMLPTEEELMTCDCPFCVAYRGRSGTCRGPTPCAAKTLPALAGTPTKPAASLLPAALRDPLAQGFKATAVIGISCKVASVHEIMIDYWVIIC